MCNVTALTIAEADKLNVTISASRASAIKSSSAAACSSAGSVDTGAASEACSSTTSSSTTTIQAQQLPTKMPKLSLLHKYANKLTSTASTESVARNSAVEFQEYLTASTANVEDCLAFWNDNRKRFPRLYELAMKVHSIPATSAPVERVFSHGGVIMRPHRAGRLSDSNLANLLFLKCNNVALLKNNSA